MESPPEQLGSLRFDESTVGVRQKKDGRNHTGHDVWVDVFSD